MVKLLYLKIYLDLKEKILNGTYKADDKLPSENELSNLYQVSRITAKRAMTELENDGFIYRIQGKGSFVLPEKPSLQGSASNFVLFILPFANDLSMGDYTHDLIPLLQASGLELFVTTGDYFERKRAQDIINNFCGLIYYPTDVQEHLAILYDLKIKQFPMVILDKTIPNLNIPSIMSDNIEGARLATEHLIELGHNKITYVYNNEEKLTQPMQERYIGYIKALDDAQLEYRTSLIDSGRVLTDILSFIKDEKITAAVCENDITTIKLIQKLEAANYKVPEDFSVVGFDDIYSAKLITPSLTTIVQNFKEIGKTAGILLLNQLEKNNVYPESITIPVELIIRDSTTYNSSSI